MKKPLVRKGFVLLVLLGIITSLGSFTDTPERKPVRRKAAGLHTIIIDPGHGGFDSGCKGLFSKEKDVSLAISLRLGPAIGEAFPDIKIIYTRTTDIMPGNATNIHSGLAYRADLANKSKGDLFLCVHCDSDGHTPGQYKARRIVGYKMMGKGKKRKKRPVYEEYYVKNTHHGTSTLIWKAQWGAYKGAVINQNDSVVGEDMGDSANSVIDQSSPEARMRAQLYEKKYFANSALFATLVENEFTRAGRISGGVWQRQEGIWVLEATGMPSVLIETGFLTNKEEEEYLNSEDGQNEVVRNIVDALKRYKDSLEGRGTGESTSVLPARKKTRGLPPQNFMIARAGR